MPQHILLACMAIAYGLPMAKYIFHPIIRLTLNKQFTIGTKTIYFDSIISYVKIILASLALQKIS